MKYPTFCRHHAIFRVKNHIFGVHHPPFLVFTIQTFSYVHHASPCLLRVWTTSIITPTNVDPENPETHGRVYVRWRDGTPLMIGFIHTFLGQIQPLLVPNYGWFDLWIPSPIVRSYSDTNGYCKSSFEYPRCTMISNQKSIKIPWFPYDFHYTAHFPWLDPGLAGVALAKAGYEVRSCAACRPPQKCPLFVGFWTHEKSSLGDIFPIWLVVWNMNGWFFPAYWECHHPNWRTHIFQRAPTTNQPIVGWCSYYKGHLATLEGYEYQLISRVGECKWATATGRTMSHWPVVVFFAFFEDGKPHHHEVFIVGFTTLRDLWAHGYVSQYLPRTARGDEHRIPWWFEEHDVLNHWISLCC